MGVSEEEFIQGQIEKKNYRKKWLANAKKDKDHPINHGIHMDTHHLISAEAIKISNLGGSLKNKGYVIDSLNNLVGFPSTLPGACHLKAQLHRGDHTYAIPGEKPYHDYVESSLRSYKQQIKSCYGRTKKKEDESEIHQLLDALSSELLDEINDFELPLTVIFEDFEEEECNGCKNSYDINESRGQYNVCEKERNHFGEVDLKYQGSKQAWNKKVIKYKGDWKPKVRK
jgi:hypothetical protein